MARFFIAALVALSVCSARPALAQDRPEPDAEALGTHQKNIRVDLGLRTQFVANAGLDPFSENDVVPQLALGASWGFYANEELSVAAMAGFDYGSLSSRARSSDGRGRSRLPRRRLTRSRS